jgi:uncharacterized protein (DUF1501 family)
MANPQQSQRAPTLILIQLAGGNDGLNTLIPYADPRYYELRPTLAIETDQVLRLNDQVGLHPALHPLMDAWQANEWAWIEGVGYQSPNRSHFRSIDIWETGSNRDEFLSEGWLAQVHAQRAFYANVDTKALVLGGSDQIFQGGEFNFIKMKPNQQGWRQIHQWNQNTLMRPANQHAQYIDQKRSSLVQFVDHVYPQFASDSRPAHRFGRHNLKFSKQLHMAAQLMATDVHIPVIKLSLGGFDTHDNQANRHRVLLQTLAQGLAQFRQEMIDLGCWNQCLIMSYSEFGRRARENGNRGTDHGTAAAHWMLGGAVQGGLYGSRPSLDLLDHNDLIYQVDYRSLYATLLQNWFGIHDHPYRDYPLIPCV